MLFPASPGVFLGCGINFFNGSIDGLHHHIRKRFCIFWVDHCSIEEINGKQPSYHL